MPLKIWKGRAVRAEAQSSEVQIDEIQCEAASQTTPDKESTMESEPKYASILIYFIDCLYCTLVS